jgi:hypothetical protein
MTCVACVRHGVRHASQRVYFAPIGGETRDTPCEGCVARWRADTFLAHFPEARGLREWRRRLERVCQNCGQRAVGDDGRCTSCGALKRRVNGSKTRCKRNDSAQLPRIRGDSIARTTKNPAISTLPPPTENSALAGPHRRNRTCPPNPPSVIRSEPYPVGIVCCWSSRHIENRASFRRPVGRRAIADRARRLPARRGAW